MPRRHVAALAVAVALLGSQAAVARAPGDGTGRPRGTGSSPTEVVVTRPDGFAWPEVLLGVGIGGVLLTVAAGVRALHARRAVAPSAMRRGLDHPIDPGGSP